MTAAGAALVFATKKVNLRVMDSMLGFAAGVMIAASFWSLLAPDIEMARQMGHTPWLTAAIGFMAGGVFMRLADLCLPHLHPGMAMQSAEGIKIPLPRLAAPSASGSRIFRKERPCPCRCAEKA